jgi:hypothetical protein
MGKFLFTLIVALSNQAHAFELPAKLEKVVGKTFSQPGPNCFAAALYGSDVYDSFRGVSENEFAEVLKAACRKVDDPKMGDVGVYSSEGFGFIHAFVYLDKDAAFEKQGVDYVGKTPIRIQSQDSIDYIHIASPECRRWGDERCHNQKAFYRCGSVSLNSKFELTLNKVNALLEKALESEVVEVEIQLELNRIYWTLGDDAISDLEKAVFESVQKQMAFFKFDTNKMLIY